MMPQINIATEASDSNIPFVRTSVHTFIKNNQWFRGTLFLLTSHESPISSANLSSIKAIYGNISIIQSSQFDKLSNFIKSNIKLIGPQNVINFLKYSIFFKELDSPIFYFNSKSLFIKDISKNFIDSGTKLDDKLNYIYLTPSNPIDLTSIDTYQYSGEFNFASWILDKVEPKNYFLENFYTDSSNYPDQKFKQLSGKLTHFNAILFNNLNNQHLFKISQIWLQKNKESIVSQTRNNINISVNKNTAKLVSNKTKLGVVYIVFDGVELLEQSILQIRPHVDYITVVYQSFSWFNKKMSIENLNILKYLEESKIIDNLTEFNEFTPLSNYSVDSIKKAKKYETLKRTKGLKNCISSGCTHYLCMDVDEFYSSSDFEKAKNLILTKGYSYSACKYINYVTPNLHRGFGEMYVPFICKIDNSSIHGPSFFVKVDPTRGVSSKTIPSTNKILIDYSLLVMHHMETVRLDLYSKYESTTRLNLDRNRLRELVDIVKSATVTNSKNINFKKIMNFGLSDLTLTYVENIFNIDYQNW